MTQNNETTALANLQKRYDKLRDSYNTIANELNVIQGGQQLQLATIDKLLALDEYRLQEIDAVREAAEQMQHGRDVIVQQYNAKVDEYDQEAREAGEKLAEAEARAETAQNSIQALMASIEQGDAALARVRAILDQAGPSASDRVEALRVMFGLEDGDLDASDADNQKVIGFALDRHDRRSPDRFDVSVDL